jgi:hypothetical protein
MSAAGRALRTLLLATVLACALSACGGGDHDDEETDQTPRPPLDCKARPELCI